MSTLIQDLRYGLRTLRKSPGFALVNVLTLALGVGATSALFSVIHGVLLRPLPFPEPERIVQLHTVFQGDDSGGRPLSPPNFASVEEGSRAFEAVSAVLPGDLIMEGVGEPRAVESARVSASFFRVMAVQPALGRAFLPEENQPGRERVAVLGDGLWQRAFGADPRVVGRSITLDGVAYTVVGVMPAGFSFPEDRELWVPVPYEPSFSAASVEGRTRNTWVPVLARLREGVDLRRGRQDLGELGRRLAAAFPESNTGVGFTAVPLHETMVGAVRAPLLLLFGAVAVVLLAACANVVGLLLARAAARQPEMVVRVALGAGRGRLVRQLLTEAVLLGSLGGALGLLVAVWATEALVAMRPVGIPRIDSIEVDGVVLAFTLGVTLAVSLLAGLVPALRATESVLSGTLRGSRGTAAPGGGARLRGGLVIGQMALAVVLLVGSGLLLRSFARLMAVDPGFRSERVLSFRVELPEAAYGPGEVRAFYARLLERLGSASGVQGAGAVSRLPIAQGSLGSRFSVEGRPNPDGAEPSIGVLGVTPGYFHAMGIPLLRGRGIADLDREGSPAVVVINQAAAETFFPGEDPVGRRLERFSYNPIEEAAERFTVVGVVADVRGEALDQAPEPEAYFAHAQVPFPTMQLVVRAAGEPMALSGAVRRELAALDAGLPAPQLRTMEEVVGESVARPRFIATLLTLFAGVTLALAAVGIFGLLSYTVAQRTREIGVRLALGARPGEVVRMVLRRTLLLAGAGIVLGAAGSVALARLLKGQLFGVGTLDPPTYAAVVVLLAGTALAAGLVPARRAAAVDPVHALRAE